MEFEYKDNGNTKILLWILVIVFTGVGIMIFNDIAINKSMFIIIMIANMIMQIIQYRIIKNKGMGIVEYLNYGRTVTVLIIIYGIIIFTIVISGENANIVLAVWMFIIVTGLIILGQLLKKSNDTENIEYPSDKIILNEEGIKIPEYRFIEWEDISNVIEYETKGSSIIGVLVSNERAYRIRNYKIENLLFGKEIRLITIMKSRVRGEGGLKVSELVVAMKENMKG